MYAEGVFQSLTFEFLTLQNFAQADAAQYKLTAKNDLGDANANINVNINVKQQWVEQASNV